MSNPFVHAVMNGFRGKLPRPPEKDRRECRGRTVQDNDKPASEPARRGKQPD